jgi:signal transduction histidine kinase
VVTNLVTNAINYTPVGGRIVVSAAVTDEWVTLTVLDNGPGIAAKDLPHLFERFYRGEVGRLASAPGTGLGLAISREIIDRLGGRITVDSVSGQGAAFTVWLRPAG